MRERIRNTKIPMWTFILIFITVLGGVMYMPAVIKVSNNVNGRELPIYRVKTDEKNVALTFDLSWGGENIEEVLGILEKHNVKATFFITGNWSEEFPDYIEKMIELGHDIGNHSLNHENMTQLSMEEKKAEISIVHEYVKNLTGYEMNLFRPPYGAYDNEVIRSGEELGYYTIRWSVNSLDWKDYGKESIIKTVVEHEELKNGAIILMNGEAKYTKEALEEVILGIREKGYEFVPLSELIYTEDYYLEVDGTQVEK